MYRLYTLITIILAIKRDGNFGYDGIRSWKILFPPRKYKMDKNCQKQPFQSPGNQPKCTISSRVFVYYKQL